MQRKAIQGIVVALLALGAIGVQAAEPITIINADFQQDEDNLNAVAPNQWLDGVTNWVANSSGVQWDLVEGEPSINAWINGGGWLETHALDAGSGNIEVVSNQSITVTFDLALGGNPVPSYAVDVYSTDGDILLATTGNLDVTGLTPQTWYPAQSHVLQWLGATPSANGFDIVISNPGGQIWVDNVVATNDDPDPSPLPPVWSADPITGDSGLVGHPYTGTLAGLAIDPNWDVVIYSRDSSGDAWLNVATDGTLSGTPTTDGSKTFTVIASDGTLSSTATLNIEVATGTAPVWNPNPITIATDAFVGAFYSNSVANYVTEPDGDTLTYTKQSGPSWLSVDSGSGAITGMPTEIGDTPNVFEILVEDLDGSDLATVNILVSDEEGVVIAVIDGGGADHTTVVDLSTGDNDIGAMTGSFSSDTYGWTTGDQTYWNDTEGGFAPDETSATATWIFGNMTVGSEWDVFSTWKPQANRSQVVPFTIQGGADILINQQPAPLDDLVLDDGTASTSLFSWQKIGTGTVNGDGELVITLSGATGGWAIIDGMAITSAPLAPIDPAEDLTIFGPVTGGTEMVISWTALDKGTYGVETNSTLIFGGWQTFMTGLSKPGGGTITVTNTVGPDQTFYRVITE